jgi:uroporphyrinogen III methyltransferase/synthase
LTEGPRREGFVSLVGAGPGDPGLITVRGKERLRAAEVVVYDHLVGRALLDEAPAESERIYVGKWAGNRAMPQEEICALLVERAQRGQRVVRLKGGDPFVFGRGGEEASALAAHGVAFEVVPGVSAVSAVPAYAGIPVTDRRASSSFIVVTGHEDPTRGLDRVRWGVIAQAADTIVVLMGTSRLAAIARALIEGGRPPETPAAVIQWGSTPEQRTVTATLAEIAAAVAEAGLKAPSTLVVGDVVALRERLRWFDNRPLHGARVLVTRSREQAAGLGEELARLGAVPVYFPVLAIAPPASTAALDHAVSRLAEYDWLVLTSTNAVDALFERMGASGIDARALAGCRVCAVGPATAASLELRGIIADLVPEEASGEGVLAALSGALGERGLAEARFLMPRAEEGRDVIPDGISAAGGRIDVVTAYRTVCPEEPDAAALAGRLLDGGVRAVTFTSPSAVRNLLGRLGGGERARALLDRAAIVTIGPTTTAAVEASGLRVAAEAAPHTVKGLVDAVLSVLSVLSP